MPKPDMTTSQRSAAVDRVGQNVALRSGAGCGKTFVLARRFTELLMQSSDENPLPHFVAMTFTEKAALEMSQRVREMLANLARDAKGPSRQKVLAWLEEIDQARISTIHGFCSTLLRTYAVQAGLDPSFGLCADEMAVAQMSAEACQQALLEAVQGKDTDAGDLLLSVAFEPLAAMLQTLLDHRTMWDPANYANTDAIRTHWRTLADKARQQAWLRLEADKSLLAELDDLKAIECADANDKLLAFRDAQVAIMEQVLRDPAGRTPENFQALCERPGGIGSRTAWPCGAKAVRDQLKSLAERICQYAIFAEQFGPLDDQAATALAALVRLAVRAQDLFAQQKRRQGVLDFTDLLLYARRLLETQPAIRQALRQQIHQLLVDECQDTDAFQVALILMAVFPDAAWQTMLANDGRPPTLPEGKLFFVGDAKQSIYRFRGAQVEVFESLCRQFGPTRQENLDVSFRTHSAGVAFVNHLFEKLMADDFSPTDASRKFADSAGDRGPSVEILLADGPDGQAVESADDAAKAQAAATAWRIRQMLDRREKLVWDRQAGAWRAVEAGDIAILFARMTNSLEYERELARRDVPYYVVAGTGFYRQQEVFDLFNALRVIDNPFDDIAFMGLCRSSLLGLDDNALMHLSLQIERPYLPGLQAHLLAGRALAGLDNSQSRSLALLADQLASLTARKDAMGIDEVMEHFVDATGYGAILLSQFQGRRMLGNVRMLIEQARSAAAAGLSLADFVRQVSQRVMDDSRYEQAAVAGEGENVVRLMTIHKAKGLEFPVVIVPDLNAGRRGRTDSIIIRSDWGLVYQPPKSQDESDEDGPDKPLSYRLAAWSEDLDDQRENIRRLYVAVTRHEDHLVLLGANQRNLDGRFAKNSYLAMLDDVLGIGQAIDGKSSAISYGKGLSAAVRVVCPQTPQATSRDEPPGQALLKDAKSADALAAGLLSLAPAKGDLPLVGPLPPTIGGAELAVTALSEFGRCPLLYRWRHELRVPNHVIQLLNHQAGTSDARPSPSARGGLDPATVGTLLHRCMEHLDLKDPQPAAALLTAQAQELGLDCTDLSPLAAEFEQMLVALQAQPLWTALGQARTVHRELDFVMEFPPAILRGQIDLVYEDAAGAWHIVDYKSDRLGGQSPAEHAARYQLQVLLYAIAAGRCAGVSVADATVYYVRTAQSHTVAITPDLLAGVGDQARELAVQLIASRRSGQYQRREEPSCRYCPYSFLCGK